MSLASDEGHALVNVRLYMPKEWDRKRMAAAGVPKERRKFRTRHELALMMLKEQRESLPHGWVAGDDEMGRSSLFRRDLDDLGERYLLAVPSNTTVRDLAVYDSGEIEYQGRETPRKMPFVSVDDWVKDQPEDRWKRIVVRKGSRGPLEVDVMVCRVQTKIERRAGDEERLVVIRYVNVDKIQHDYYLTNADETATVEDYARVAKLEHTIEEAPFNKYGRQAKSECGLADYQVRNCGACFLGVGIIT